MEKRRRLTTTSPVSTDADMVALHDDSRQPASDGTIANLLTKAVKEVKTTTKERAVVTMKRMMRKLSRLGGNLPRMNSSGLPGAREERHSPAMTKKTRCTNLTTWTPSVSSTFQTYACCRALGTCGRTRCGGLLEKILEQQPPRFISTWTHTNKSEPRSVIEQAHLVRTVDRFPPVAFPFLRTFRIEPFGREWFRQSVALFTVNLNRALKMPTSATKKSRASHQWLDSSKFV